MRIFQLPLIVAMAVIAAACGAKAHTRTEVVMPELMPPPPPPRIVETYVDELVPTIQPSPVDTALMTPPSSPAPVPAPIVTTPPVRTEPPRIEPEERPASTPPTLTLVPAPGTEAKTEASIRLHLERAQRDLQRVNYAALDADGRAQYDSAKRFMQLSEDSLKEGNLAYAGKLADKAVTMAAVLVP